MSKTRNIEHACECKKQTDKIYDIRIITFNQY